MSGPVAPEDTAAGDPVPHPAPSGIEVTDSREARVGSARVRRALPRRTRRTVGAWCFIDHMGPDTVTAEDGIGVAPHPHIGLQTVTWLFEGEILHRDSLGSEQVIKPGQLNLMTAGAGVSHSEESTGRYAGTLHGVQLWVAQPSATRTGEAAFEHHAALPRVDMAGATVTVIVGSMPGLDGADSPARRDTDHLGAELDLRGDGTTLALRADYEHAVVVADGAAAVDGTVVEPGRLAYLAPGRDEARFEPLTPSARALLVGGVPFPEPVVMWWNFVGRSQDEISAAYDDWAAGRTERFGRVDSRLPRVEVGPPPWWRPSPWRT